MRCILFLVIFFSIIPYAKAEFDPLEAVAAVIIREAGGEGHTGMWAVANVIENRVQRSHKTPFDIVSAPRQFSSVNSVIMTKRFTWEKIIESAKHHPEWNRALDLANKVKANSLPDITGGATNFHSGTDKPIWARSMLQTAHIGGHFFYKEN